MFVNRVKQKTRDRFCNFVNTLKASKTWLWTEFDNVNVIKTNPKSSVENLLTFDFNKCKETEATCCKKKN